MFDLTNFIDKHLSSITEDSHYKKYFNDVDLREDEGIYYLTNKDAGIGLVMNNDNFSVQSIHLFSGNYMDSKEFKGELPFKLQFSHTKQDIKNIFGEPNRKGGGHKDIFFGYVPLWEKYFFEKFSLHFQYSEDGHIDLITIGSLKLENYFDIGLQ